MLKRSLLWLGRVCVLICVAASTLLFVHYLAPADSGLCGGTSGCESVRRSGLGYFFDTPYLNMPLLGVVSFSVLFLLTLGVVRGPQRRWLQWLRWMYALAALAAVALILLQALYVEAYCWLCMLVDVSAVAAALAIVSLPVAETTLKAQHPGLKTWGWLSLLALALGLPVLWPQLRTAPETPAAIAARAPGPGVAVIEFADFECPHCRHLDPVLKQVVRQYGDKVHFVRLQMPLPSHSRSMPAAKAALCAAKQGKTAQMADLLFNGELEDPDIARYARAIGLDLTGFERCLAAAATEAEIEADVALLSADDFRGLPTTYIGGQRVVGLAAAPVYQELIERELLGRRPLGIPGWLFVSLALCLVVFVCRLSLVED